MVNVSAMGPDADCSAGMVKPAASTSIETPCPIKLIVSSCLHRCARRDNPADSALRSVASAFAQWLYTRCASDAALDEPCK